MMNKAGMKFAIAAFVALLGCAWPAAAAGDPVMGAADSLRTGWYPDEAQLTPQLLEGGGFGQIFDTPVQGQVYAQPLVSGNTLLVATQDDWIYGIDPQSGAIQWERKVGTPWNSADLNGCPNPGPHVGITGTPVIDPATEIAYFYAKTYVSGNSGQGVWSMHAVSMKNGKEEPGFPVEIPEVDADNLARPFEPNQLLERPALLLLNGVVYAGFGSLCDEPPFRGWVVGVSTSGEIKSMWADSENGASVWQGGGGFLSDGDGQILFTSGNSESNGFGIGGTPPPKGPGNAPPEGMLGESVVRLTVQGDGSVKPTDFFSPAENLFIDEGDLDLGSGAPLGLPSQYFGTEAIPDLMVQLGKQGVVYLLNRDDLGGMGQGGGTGQGPGGEDAIVQELANPVPGAGGLWGGMATWPGDGGYIYVPSTGGDEIEGTVGSFEIFKYSDKGGTPELALVAESPNTLGYGSGSPIVTSSGATNGSGIVWQTTCSHPFKCEGSTLDAYSAVPANGSPHLLWSGQIGAAAKFARPDANGGRIYVGTFDGHLRAFGPIAREQPPAPQSPAVVPPPDTMITGATIKTKNGTAMFKFAGTGAVSGFECELIRPKRKGGKRPRPSFSSCASPRRYNHLKPGRYTFEVRAVNSVGSDPTPAARKFKV
jgi:hypothetical protein